MSLPRRRRANQLSTACDIVVRNELDDVWIFYFVLGFYFVYMIYTPFFDPLHLLFEASAPDLLNLLNIIHDHYA